MPLYISRIELERRYGSAALSQAADLDGDQDLDSALDVAISDAEAKVNSYVGARYSLPLPNITERPDPENNSDVPPILRRVAGDIALYYLSPSHDVLTEERSKRYKTAVKWLEDLVAHKVTLGYEEPSTVSETVEYTTADRIMTRSKMDGVI